MSQALPARTKRIAYTAATGALAAAVVAVSFAFGELPNWYELLGFAFAACLLGSRTIKLSPTLGTVSVGFMFVFATLVELGPVAGVIAGAASAVGGTLLCSVVCQRKKRPRAIVVFSALGNIVLAAGAAGWAYAWLDSIYAETGISMGVLPAFIVIGVYYMINSLGMAFMVSADGERTVLHVWSDSLSWTVLPFYVGGAVVMLVHVVAVALGPYVWFALIPTAAIIHVALEFRAKARAMGLAGENVTER